MRRSAGKPACRLMDMKMARLSVEIIKETGMHSKGLFTSWMVSLVIVLASVSGCGNADVSATSSAQPTTSDSLSY